VHYGMKVLPLFQNYLYRPVVRFVTWVARVLQPIQSGDVNWYLLYILVVVVAAYFVAAR
jgi:hydrogenase-4 component B